jgi:transposase InsO family protein
MPLAGPGALDGILRAGADAGERLDADAATRRIAHEVAVSGRTQVARSAQSGRLRRRTQTRRDADAQDGHQRCLSRAEDEHAGQRSSASGLPYLLKNLVIERANHVWAADISYLPMAKGFVYLVAIIDWASRRVLAWRTSNTLTTDFCVDALHEALTRYGTPEIFNTDQGSQFTSDEFTAVLKDAGVRISMDGKGRWLDNVFVERLWRSVKYEEVYLHAYGSIAEANRRLAIYFDFYNRIRTHQSLDGMTPDVAYFASAQLKVAA